LTRAITTLAALLALTLLTDCAGWGCDGWEKFKPSRHDAESTKAQALKHNNFGRAQGCWK